LTVKFDLTAPAQSAKPASGDSAAARDAALIARILGGERELFHELVRPYEKSVYFATFSILQNEQDAEDAAQETMLKALKNLHNFRAESKFSTWLISIAVNEARARMRHARVLKFESVDQPAEDEEGSFTPAVITDWREVPLQALERKELREQLQRAIASLPEIYREVLLLRDVEEFNIAETTAALGVSEGVVKTRLLRARLMMQKILAPQLQSKKSGLFGLFRSKAGGSWF
jgi:RNA polymerase sigma-70 factor (ECF subfamily)